MMYPLTRKNTSTPYMPRLNAVGRSQGMAQVVRCSPTTASAPMPRSASSHASLEGAACTVWGA